MKAKDLVARVTTLVHRNLFLASKGRIGGRLLGMPVVMLATTGRKSGKRRLTMLCAPLQVGDTVIVVGANTGDERHPAWYRNLCANPEVEVTARGRTRRLVARTALGDQRTELWTRIAGSHPSYATAARRTSREIPVVILEPRP